MSGTRSITPWDEAAFYAVPTETQYTLTASAQQVAPGDPMRRVLVFGVTPGLGFVSTGNTALLSINPAFTNAGGIPISTQPPVMIFTWEEHGPLVQQAWYAMLPNGVVAANVLSVQTVRYNTWPGDSNRLSLIQQVDANAENTVAQLSNRNGKQRKLYSNSGKQSGKGQDSDIPSLIQQCQRGFDPACNRNVWLAPDSWRVPSGPGGRGNGG